MGQYWKLFNVSKCQTKTPNGGPKWPFFECKQEFLVRSITVPFPSPELERHLERLSSTRPANNNKGFLSLPDELLLDILDLPEIQWDELVVLAVTCRRLFDLSRKMIDYYRTLISAPWARCRIVCIGDSYKYAGLPATLLTADERMVIDAKIKQGEYADYGGLELLNCHDADLYRGAFTFSNSWRRKFGSSVDQKAFKFIAGVTFSPERTDWALCNLTKKEYVRASAVAELAGKPNDPQPFLPRCRLDLGHALLTRICWSNEALPNTPPKMKIHNGPWVGDRFCITTMGRWAEPKEGEEPWEWKVVSSQVVRELLQVYRVAFEKDWLAEVEGNVLITDHAEPYWFGSDGEDRVASAGRGLWSPWPSL
ncbi:hypothetical protein C8T65DRAFT_725430 [Cerioporus squamosus]|nr:hypothetical protein C8T65DRAFT_725430 [Cerioporus squamosus]